MDDEIKKNRMAFIASITEYLIMVALKSPKDLPAATIEVMCFMKNYEIAHHCFSSIREWLEKLFGEEDS